MPITSVTDKDDQESGDNEAPGSASERKPYDGPKPSGGDTPELGGISDKVGAGYNPAARLSSAGKLLKFFWGSRRRKQASITGGITGITIGGGLLALTFFSTTGFEFVQIAQTLEHLHFGSQQNLQDAEFVKMVRYAKDIPKGVIERSRMGFIGNRYADYYEGQLSESGLSSAYTDKLGLLDGYVVDTDQADLTGLKDNPNAMKAAIADKYGVNPKNVVTGDTIKGAGVAIDNDSTWVIETASLHFRETYSLNYSLLRQAGLSKLSAAIGSRLFCLRAACDWHPLSNILGQNPKRGAEEAYKKLQSDEETGAEADTLTQDESQSETKANPADAATTATEAATLTSDAGAANRDSSLIPSFSGSIKGLFTGGIAGAALICILYNLNSQVGKIQEQQIILPLIRMAMQALSIGGQILNGQDVNPTEMSDLAQQFYGKDTQGQVTDWSDSKSIQTNLGNPNTGVAPDPTLSSISQGSPFAFIGDIPGVSGICSTAGQVAQGVIGFAIDFSGIGAAFNALAKGAVQGVGINVISEQAAKWLAGKAVDVAAVGADYGSELDFGAALGASQQAITSGGTALTTSQSTANQSNAVQAYNQQLQHESLADKIFSTDDPESLASKLLDNFTPSFFKNVGIVISHLSHIFSYIAEIPSLLFKKVNAATTSSSYNYPFPSYGFSQQDIDDPVVENPYTNANYVTCNLLPPNNPTTDCTGDSSSPYVSKALSCFGVTISAVNGQWDVTAPANSPSIDPYTSTYSGLGCNEPTPVDCTNNSTDACNWLRVRFFILDTETENSMGCFAGDGQSCSDVGFDQVTSSSSAVTSTSTMSNQNNFNATAAKQLAQQDSTNGTKVGFALYDSNGNNIASDNGTFENYGASITKSMLLVAYLNQIGNKALSSQAKSYLTNMIENSDNVSANWVYSHLTNGPSEVKRVANQAGMTGFIFNTSDPVYVLGQSQITANDFAILFSKINTLITPSHEAFAMNLLSNLSSVDQVGLLKSGLPTPVYSKEGWKPESNPTAYVVNQAAQFSDNGTTYGIAVTIDGGPSATQTSDETIVQDLVSALTNNSAG